MNTVSLIEFQVSVANLSVAQYALRDEPYERLPYLAGTLQLTQMQMEMLRKEAMDLRGAVLRLHELLHKANSTFVPSTDVACSEIAAALRDTKRFTEE